MSSSCRRVITFTTFDQNDIEQALAYARQEFELASGSAGSTIRDQLKLVWKNTGIKPKELDDLIELPASCLQVWNAFCDLNAARGSNGFGVNPLNYTEIKSYFDLLGIQPDEAEIKLIKQFDNAALEQFAKDSKAKGSNSGK